MTLIWSRIRRMEQDRLKWRGGQMDEDVLRAAAETRKKGAFKRWTCPCLTSAWKRRKLPQDSGFKRVAPSLGFHQLLGRDLGNSG